MIFIAEREIVRKSESLKERVGEKRVRREKAQKKERVCVNLRAKIVQFNNLKLLSNAFQ